MYIYKIQVRFSLFNEGIISLLYSLFHSILISFLSIPYKNVLFILVQYIRNSFINNRLGRIKSLKFKNLINVGPTKKNLKNHHESITPPHSTINHHVQHIEWAGAIHNPCPTLPLRKVMTTTLIYTFGFKSLQ